MNSAEAKPPIKEDMWEAIDIYLFSNGQQHTPPRKYHLQAEDLISWEDVLYFLARSHYGNTHSSLRLHTLDGQPVEGPLELRDGLAYVAVAGSEIFIDSGYEKYLSKANKSREKRQAKLSCAEIEPTSSLACHPCCSCHRLLEYSMITNKNEQPSTPVTTNDTDAPEIDSTLNPVAFTKPLENIIDSVTTARSKIANKSEVSGDQIPVTYPADASQREYTGADPKQQPQPIPVNLPKQVDKQRSVNKSRGIFRNNRLPISQTLPLKKSIPDKMDSLERISKPKGLARSNLRTTPVGSKLKPSSKFPLKRGVPFVAKTPQNKVNLITTSPDTSTIVPIVGDKIDRDEEKEVLVTNQSEAINNESNALSTILEATVDKNSDELQNQNKSETKPLILVNKEVQINVDQTNKEVNTTEKPSTAEKIVETIDNFATKGVGPPTQEENRLVASNATDDNVIAVINKGDVVNIKLNIYLNNSKNLKSGSNAGLNDGMVVQTSVQSMHSSMNHEFIKTYLSEGSQKVTFVRKECLCRYGNSETLAKSENANKNSDTQSAGNCAKPPGEQSRMTSHCSSGYLLKKANPTTSLETFENNTTADKTKQNNEVTFSVNDAPVYVSSEITEHKLRKYSDVKDCSDYIIPTISSTPSQVNEPELVIVIAEPATTSIHSIKSTVDKSTQTDWCCVLLEARCHDDGRYSFHLPPLDVLRLESQSSQDTQQ